MSGYAVHLANGSWLAVGRYEQDPGDGALLAWTDDAPWPYRIPRSEWRGIAPASNLINAAASSGKRRTKRRKPSGKEFSVKAEDKVRDDELLTPIEVQKGSRFAFTDDGNASRFAEDHRSDLVYASGPGWHRWAGKRWRAIPNEDVLKEARASARKIREEAADASDHDAAMRAVKWAHSSESAGRLQAMVRLAQGGDELESADIKIDVGDLDRNRDILNTPAGVVDLMTGKLLGAKGKDEYCTCVTRAPYDPKADQREWLRFLDRIMPDPELRAALKRCAGASTTGNTPKAMFALVGASGDNGKTQLLEAIAGVLGGYAGTTMESTFTKADSREAGYQLAELRAARFLSFSETREGHGLATERIKRVTGGDTITARAPGGRPFDYKPQFSLWLATNHAPVIPAREKAMWKRLWAFPFDEVIPKDEQVEDFGELLVRQHGAGILAWLVEGAMEFYDAGRKLGRQPEAMEGRREEWQDRDDVVKRWLDERTEKAPRRQWVGFAELWDSFEVWCRENGEKAAVDAYTTQTFHGEVDEHYPRSDKKKDGRGFRSGLQLRRLG